MKPVREAYWLTEEWRKKNLRYYPFYGRGFVQLTWEKNYAEMSKIVGVDLVADPDKALELDVAGKILVYGMEHGSFTSHAMHEYFTDTKMDFIGARQIINGLDKAAVIGDIAGQVWAALLP